MAAAAARSSRLQLRSGSTSNEQSLLGGPQCTYPLCTNVDLLGLVQCQVKLHADDGGRPGHPAAYRFQ